MKPSFFNGLFKIPPFLLIVAMTTLTATVSKAQISSPFTLVAMPDIENETDGHTDMLQSQINWIENNRTTSNIVCVAQQGDVVNLPTTNEYTTATSILYPLLTNAPGLPFGILPGNHDTDGIVNYEKAINASDFAGQSWYGGASGVSGSDSCSSYLTFNGGGRNFLMLNIQYNPSLNVLNWAQNIITAHPGMPTIINTHDYLTGSNTRSAMGDTIYSQALTNNPDGLINGNSQVFMVLCGHIFSNPARLISFDKDGKPVFQCMADYQDQNTINYGDGYLRLYQFDEANSEIKVSTYSAYDITTPSLTGTADQFIIPVDFNSRFGAVPEPSSLLLLGLAGLGALTCFRRHGTLH